MKRIIFDLDDTLIMWKEEYWSSLNKSLEQLNFKYDDKTILNLKESLDYYEKENNRYDKLLMKKHMEKYAKIELPNNFLETWINNLKECVPKNIEDEIKNTLQYLNNKYELVILTNWFTEPQVDRLKNAKILNYFSSVIGADLEDILNKPNEQSYLKACYPLKPEECIMIGDSLEKDVIGPMNIGMQAILFDYKNIYKGDIKKIEKISQLKEIL